MGMHSLIAYSGPALCVEGCSSATWMIRWSLSSRGSHTHPFTILVPNVLHIHSLRLSAKAHPKTKIIFQPPIFRCYVGVKKGSSKRKNVYKTNLRICRYTWHSPKQTVKCPADFFWYIQWNTKVCILICSISAVQKLNAGFDVKPECSERSVKASLLFENGKQKSNEPKNENNAMNSKIGNGLLYLTKHCQTTAPKKKHVSVHCSKKSTINKRNIATIDLQFVRLLGGHLPCQRMWLENNTFSSPLKKNKDELRRRLSIPSGKLT